MLIAWVPVLAIVVGVLLWLLASKPVVQRMGEIIFFWGIGVTLLATAHTTIELLGKR
jgi:Na+/phosphate symporter